MNGNYSFIIIPINTQPICGLLTKDDTILLVGGVDQNILYFSIKDDYLLDPQPVRECKLDNNVTFIAPFDIEGENFLIGYERGRIDILDSKYLE